jgi:hypothetical protein
MVRTRQRSAKTVYRRNPSLNVHSLEPGKSPFKVAKSTGQVKIGKVSSQLVALSTRVWPSNCADPVQDPQGCTRSRNNLKDMGITSSSVICSKVTQVKIFTK